MLDSRLDETRCFRLRKITKMKANHNSQFQRALGSGLFSLAQNY